MKQILKRVFVTTRPLADSAFHLFFPKHCFGCGETDQQLHVPNLCVFCWSQTYRLHRITYPHFTEMDVYATGRYQHHLKKIILLAKFRRNILCVDLITELLHHTIQNIPFTVDFLTSVPSYYIRSVFRGFDLPAMLAIELSKKTGIPYRSRILSKKKWVRRQGKISKTERMKNVQGAFSASAEAKGKNILVIDDILTTGSTAIACYKALRKQKPSKVIFLTVGKT